MSKFVKVVIKPKFMQGVVSTPRTIDLSKDAILLFRTSNPGIVTLILKPEYENRIMQGLGIDLKTGIEPITITEHEAKKLYE